MNDSYHPFMAIKWMVSWQWVYQIDGETNYETNYETNSAGASMHGIQELVAEHQGFDILPVDDVMFSMNGVPPKHHPKSSTLLGCPFINHPFWGLVPVPPFMETPL